MFALSDLVCVVLVICVAALWASVCAWWRALKAQEAIEDLASMLARKDHQGGL